MVYDDKSKKIESAVAISYDKDKKSAPTISAAGKGDIAKKIVQIAKEHNIEIREDVNLVKILEALDVGSKIPIEAYVAVAEILSYIYNKNKYK